MTSHSKHPDARSVERAQPWLGTVVSMRVHGLPDQDAHQAIDDAFEEIAQVHRLMSFHNAASDVGRLNRKATSHPVDVHPFTFEVLQWAQIFSAASMGCFDISVAGELVAWCMLPRPDTGPDRTEGCWDDIELRPEGTVQFHCPLWIDLGGIAKGYAVDRAASSLERSGASGSVVNAGGDLRISGDHMERIALDVGYSIDPVPILEVGRGSIASSCGRPHRQLCEGGFRGPHVDGASREPAPTDRFVSVAADRCIVADALTKIVMAAGPASDGILRRFAATAFQHDPQSGWQQFGGDAA